MSEELRRVTRGSGNVFKDLDLPQPDELEEKYQLARAIKQAIEEKGLSQVQAARLSGLAQSDISNIKGFKRLDDFSCDRLMRVLTALGKDLRLIIEDAPAPRTRGQLTIRYG